MPADTRVESDPGLCATCTHMRVVRSTRRAGPKPRPSVDHDDALQRHSVSPARDREQIYYRCGKSDSDPHFPRYPVIPVLRCPGDEPGPGTR